MIKGHSLPKHCDQCGAKLNIDAKQKVINGYNSNNGKPLYKYSYNVQCPSYSELSILRKLIFTSYHTNQIISFCDSELSLLLGTKPAMTVIDKR